DRKCLFLGDFADKYDAELEDLFPEREYLSAVTDAYPEVALDFTDDEKRITSVVDRVEALFSREGLEFQKWRPAAVLRDRILVAPDKVDNETCRIVSAIFERLNELFTVDESMARPRVASGNGKRPVRVPNKPTAPTEKR